LCSEITARLQRGEDWSPVAQSAEQALLDLSSEKSGGPQKIGKVMSDAYRAVDQATHDKTSLAGLATGFPDLDFLTGGFQKADLILLAARPSMGKTALALNLALNLALGGTKVAFFSLEMSSRQLGIRLLAAESRLSSYRMRTGKIRETEWSLLTEAATLIAGCNLWIDDSPGQSVMEIRSKARRIQSQHGLDFLAIDYIQLMEGHGENRQQEITQISRELKALARELDIPVLALSQLNRALEQRSDKRPLLSDLRESGSLEQDADLVMMIHRPEYYDPEAERGAAELRIAKHRNGPVGKLDLYFNEEYVRFDSSAR